MSLQYYFFPFVAHYAKDRRYLVDLEVALMYIFVAMTILQFHNKNAVKIFLHNVRKTRDKSLTFVVKNYVPH